MRSESTTKPTVHMIWLNPPFPYRRNMRSFQRFDYKVNLWGKPKGLVNQDLFDAMKSYAGRADILRLELLYKHGGIYTDADSKMVRPLPLKADLVAMTSASGYCGNETIYATKGHPALKEAVYGLREHVKDNILTKDECNLWEIAGATYLTPIFEKYDHVRLPKEVVARKRRTHPETSIVHEYRGSWAKGIKKSQKQPIDYWLNVKELKI